MKISLIIPAYNEEKTLLQTLPEVRLASCAFLSKGWGVEIIVVDNNSTDTTAEVAGKWADHVVFEPVNQISRARNRGAQAASGDWLIFIDADSFPSARLFLAVEKHIRTGKVIGGGAAMSFVEAKGPVRLAARVWNTLSSCMRWSAGAFVFCRGDLFRSVGGFPGDLFAGEEIFFSEKMKRLASEMGRQFVIIRECSLQTSSRKFQTYSFLEHLALVFRLVLAGPKSLKDRSLCDFWYDSKRR